MNTKTLMRLFGFLLGPILFCLVLFGVKPSSEVSVQAIRVMACGTLMIAWWITNAVPVAATSLIPISLFPLLGIADIKMAALPYASPIIFLFLGGFMIGKSVEKWNLHKRIALNIVNLIGSNTKGIIGGFIIATGFVSMWMSNTATVVMMLPIATSIIEILMQNQSMSKNSNNFAVALIISIAYGANIGGIATIIGTPPNGIFVAFMKETYNYQVSFVDWLFVALPFTTLMLIVSFIVLVKIVFPTKNIKFDSSIINAEIKKLGKITKEEKILIIIFLATITLWIIRPIINEMIPDSFISDPAIAIATVIILFITPSNFSENKFLLDWNTAKNIPWAILILFGGGLSLAAALQYSGVIAYIESHMQGLQNFGMVSLISIIASGMASATTFIGNAALTGITLPIVSSIAKAVAINPLALAVPATVMASCAFMLPMSTPPNAVVYSSKYVRIIDLVKAGFVLNIVGILLSVFVLYPCIEIVFATDLSILPRWAQK